MTNLILRDSLFEDLFDVRRDFDEMFNRMLTKWPWVRTPSKCEDGPKAGWH